MCTCRVENRCGEDWAGLEQQWFLWEQSTHTTDPFHRGKFQGALGGGMGHVADRVLIEPYEVVCTGVCYIHRMCTPLQYTPPRNAPSLYSGATQLRRPPFARAIETAAGTGHEETTICKGY